MRRSAPLHRSTLSTGVATSGSATVPTSGGVRGHGPCPDTKRWRRGCDVFQLRPSRAHAALAPTKQLAFGRSVGALFRRSSGEAKEDGLLLAVSG